MPPTPHGHPAPASGSDADADAIRGADVDAGDEADSDADAAAASAAASGAEGAEVGRQLEATILDLLARRAPTSTICPSDAARAVGDDDWRDLMEPARQAAQRLVDAGQVDITQHGTPVDLATARGPIRIRRRPPAPASEQPEAAPAE